MEKSMVRNLKLNEEKLRKLHLRKLVLGEKQGPLTGKASIDMPWLKFYTEEEILCPLPNLTAYEYLKVLNADNLERKALTSLKTGKSITYKELFENVENTAKMLKRLGVKKGEVVTMNLPTCFEEVFLFYAIDKIGAIANYVIIGMPINSIVDNMNELHSTKYLTLDVLKKDAKYILDNVRSDKAAVIGLQSEKVFNKRKVTKDNPHGMPKVNPLNKNYKNDPIVESDRCPEDTLFIAKTGGTTGAPKNVLINDIGFNNVAHQFLNSSLDYKAGDTWLRLWPIFHVTSAVSGNHMPLCAGMEMMIDLDLDFTKLEDMSKIDEVILKHKPNHVLLVPPLMEIVLNSPLLKGQDLSFIKTMGCGGTKMDKALELRAKEFYKEHNINRYLGFGYGLTENSSAAAGRLSCETAEIGSVGVPLVDTTISVFDRNLDELDYNQEGEICIKSSNFMKNYLNDEELTNKVIKKHKDGNLWLHTGDLGYITEKGFVYITGRITRTIFLQTAQKVYPDVLEEQMMTVKGVKKISVIQVPDKENEGYFVPACCIIPEDGYNESQIINNILAFCKGNVASYAMPRDIHFVSQLPVTKMGKVDVKLLEKTYAKN